MPPTETAIADWFIEAVRHRQIKGWGSFESVVDGQPYLIRYEHPYVWTWAVNGPSSWPEWTRVTPHNFS